MFICNHCPYVIHLQAALGNLSQYLTRGIGVVAISSNNVANYPADAPAFIVNFTKKHGFAFPYLYDESQAVAKAYDAACTPDFFLFDTDLKCVYKGHYDSSTPGNGDALTGDELLGAMEELIVGDEISREQHASVGCNIKWK